MALNPLNSSSLEQLALKGLMMVHCSCNYTCEKQFYLQKPVFYIQTASSLQKMFKLWMLLFVNTENTL